MSRVGRAKDSEWESGVPRSARNDISWFLGVRRLTNMSDCSENPCAEGTLECGGLTPP